LAWVLKPSVVQKGTTVLNPESPEQTISLANQAAQSANHTVKSTRRAASDVMDTVATAAQEIRNDAIAPLLSRAAAQANTLSHQSADAYRQGKQRVRETASRASANTQTYVREQPVKAMLIAAAAGAAITVLVRLLSGSRTRE
jgi:ElaB/YqjD/DUF883 family membrane-anchored ribosome-binding protein